MKTKEQNVRNVSAHFRRRKRQLVNGFGKKCGMCGYDKCARVFDFHHIDPDTKEFAISGEIPHGKSWKKLIKEAQKCCMICANCHREVHAGFSAVPQDVRRFVESDAIDYEPTEEFADYTAKMNLFGRRLESRKYCAQCGKRISYKKRGVREDKYCSKACAAKSHRRYKRPKIAILIASVAEIGYEATGLKYGVSGTAIKKAIPIELRPSVRRGPKPKP